VNAEQNESRSGLSTKALIEAISINPGDTCRDESAMSEEDYILRWCSSLVRKAVDGESIEIAHFTVKEFLKEVLDDISSHSLPTRLVRIAALLRRYSPSPHPLLRLLSHVPALPSSDQS
jgi:hypothetical protein